jgi:hypothetical protein
MNECKHGVANLDGWQGLRLYDRLADELETDE